MARPFVLVHGAWFSGWTWRWTAALLRDAGHEVHTPTLTGLGERAHLATPDISLETHVLDVAGLIAFEDLTDVVLVGHSFGGMVVAGVADRVPQRIAHVVHLDAVMPSDGQANTDLQPPAYRERIDELRRAGAWLRPPPPSFADAVDQGHLTAEVARAVEVRCRPHPLKLFHEPIRLTNPAGAVLPRTYIWCRQNTATPRAPSRCAPAPTSRTGRSTCRTSRRSRTRGSWQTC